MIRDEYKELAEAVGAEVIKIYNRKMAKIKHVESGIIIRILISRLKQLVKQGKNPFDRLILNEKEKETHINLDMNHYFQVPKVDNNKPDEPEVSFKVEYEEVTLEQEKPVEDCGCGDRAKNRKKKKV